MARIARKKIILLSTISFLALLWLTLTLLAQHKGPEHILMLGELTNSQKALIVYNPDLFYNLDEQVCTAFAKGLSENSWFAKVTTIRTAEILENESFDLYVFCSNTYNWAPDRPTKTYIENHSNLKGKAVVAITLGSGSTKQSRHVLETLINEKEGKLIGSKEFWLMRPNNESRMEESNVTIALEMAYGFGKQVAQDMKQQVLFTN